MSNYIRILYEQLNGNENSVLYLKSYKKNLSKNELNKLKKSSYEGDRNLYNIIIKNKNNDDSKNTDIQEEDDVTPVVIKRIREERNISGTLQRFTTPYSSFHGDVADFNFTRPSGSEPNFVLVFTDLFTQKIFTYGFKKKSNLSVKFEEFLKDIEKYRFFFTKNNPTLGKNAKDNDIEEIRIQTDEEFTNNNKIMSIANKNKVNLFTTQVNGGHASAAEQKIKLLKEKMTAFLQGDFTETKTKKGSILKSITHNINNTVVEKYGVSPFVLESYERSLMKDPSLITPYDFQRIKKVTMANVRRDRMYNKVISSKKSRLRKLKVSDKVFIPKGRLKKSDYPGRLDKVTTNKKPFFERSIILKVTNIEKDINDYKEGNDLVLYNVEPITNIPLLKRKIQNERFTRDELYAIKDNTVSKSNYR